MRFGRVEHALQDLKNKIEYIKKNQKMIKANVKKLKIMKKFEDFMKSEKCMGNISRWHEIIKSNLISCI